MFDNILKDPLGYVARGIIKVPRRRFQALSIEDLAECERKHKEVLELETKKKASLVDDDGSPTF